MKNNKIAWKRNGAYALFWLWHLVYVVLALAVFLPYLLFPMLEDVVKGVTPWHYMLYTSLMVILPFMSVFLGATVFAKQPKNLLKYFYGFEMPLLFFLLLRVITFRELHAGLAWLMLNLTIALTTWFVFLWWQNKNADNDKEITLPFEKSYSALAAATVLAMTGLYFGVLLVLVAFPAGVALLEGVFEGLLRLFRQGINWDDLLILLHPLFYLGLIFFFFTASLFIALPVVMIKLYLGQFRQRFSALLKTKQAKPAIAIVLSIFVINISGFMLTNQQTETATLQLLDEKIAKPEYEKELLSQADAIRASLLKAYIAPYRYVSPTGTSRFLTEIYRDVFSTRTDSIEWPQAVFNSLATPFLYEGESWEREKAKKYYEYFFDTPIQKAERETILRAIKHTWETDNSNEAGLLNASSHNVHLKAQAIQLKEQKGVLTVTLNQRLENKTYEAQEVVMHFSLPEDAVVTGLWLSDDAEKLQKYPYVLAPKGAAQAVYKAEVNRRVDPALLEKTGPYQYRLRAYPVPAKSSATEVAEPLYVQLEYQTLIEENGRWAIPNLLEKRNIYWDDETQYSINGIALDSQQQGWPAWLPARMVENNPFTPAKKQVFIDDKVKIQAIPRQHNKEKPSFKQPLRILIDGSYSMAKHKLYLLSLLQQLSDSGIEFNSYFCRDDCIVLEHFSALEEQTFYGNSQTHDHMAASMRIEQQTDLLAVIILSDEGSYELATENDIEALNSPVPLWLVHFTQTLPYAYDDKVIDLIKRSKGGVGTNLMDVLMRIDQQSIKQAAGIATDSNVIGISKDYIWLEQETMAESHHTTHRTPEHNPALAKIIAAYRLKHLMHKMDMRQLDNLDAIHAIAKEHGIVSYYSSMLVLVNDRQKEALKKAEKADDRFEREVETGEQDPTTPSDLFSVPAVPEPEEWLLLIIMGGMLSVAVWRRRFGGGF